MHSDPSMSPFVTRALSATELKQVLQLTATLVGRCRLVQPALIPRLTVEVHRTQTICFTLAKTTPLLSLNSRLALPRSMSSRRNNRKHGLFPRIMRSKSSVSICDKNQYCIANPTFTTFTCATDPDGICAGCASVGKLSFQLYRLYLLLRNGSSRRFPWDYC